jgi:hypothetical protein
MKTRGAKAENASVDPAAQMVISQLEVTLSMARHFLPSNEFLAHLISMALFEAKKKPARRGRRCKDVYGACAQPALNGHALVGVNELAWEPIK